MKRKKGNEKMKYLKQKHGKVERGKKKHRNKENEKVD